MSIASVADLVETLRKSRLLTAAQMDKLLKAEARFPDSLTLAKELVRRGWVTRDQAQALLKGRVPASSPAVESPAAPAAVAKPAAAASAPVEAAPPPKGRRRAAWLLALLALLLLAGGGGLAVWWKAGGGGLGAGHAGDTLAHIDPPPKGGCSDTSDLKVLDDLDFGKPVRASFDSTFLDTLRNNKKIPELEVYPWLPTNLIAVLGEHRMRGSLIAVSPDGTEIAVGGQDGFLRLGPLDNLHEKSVHFVPGGIAALAWSPKGSVLVSSGGRKVGLWDVHDIAHVPEPTVITTDGPITSLAFSGDGKYLVGGGSIARPAPLPPAGTLLLWDMEKQHQERYRNTVPGPVQAVAFSPVAGDYRLLWGGGPGDGSLHLWNGDKGDEIAALDFKFAKEDEITSVGQVAISPDGKWAASGHAIKDPKANRIDVSARVWDLSRFAKDAEKHVLKGTPNFGPLLAFAPDSRTLAVARLVDYGVALVEVESGAQARPALTSSVSAALRYLPHAEGKADRFVFVGTTGWDNNVRIHEAPGGKELQAPIGHLALVTAVATSPDGRHLASGGYEGQVRAWDLDRVAERYVLGGGGQVWNVGFHPDGPQVFYCGQGTATVPFSTWTPASRGPGPSTTSTTGASPTPSREDGHYALTGGVHDTTVRLWNLMPGPTGAG